MKILEVLTERRKTGNLGERAAAKFLRRAGYKILERNYVAFDREIDIVARKGNETVFVEVKTRTVGHENPREVRPASSVTPEKQRKIISAAKCYKGTHDGCGRVRFDVIEVFVREGEKKKTVDRIVHLENAFNANTAM